MAAKFKKYAEYVEWQKETFDKLKGFYKPVFDAFQQLSMVYMDTAAFSYICDAMSQFDLYLRREAYEQMNKLPGIEEVGEAEDRAFLARSGALEQFEGYHEYPQFDGSTRVVQYDTNGELVFEQFI